MGFYGDADIQPMLKDIGVPVSTATVRSGTWGALNLNDTLLINDQQRGEVAVQVPSVEIQLSAYPPADIAIDAPVTVDGVNYTIRDHDAAGDGALKKLYLRKA
jgi:hypothetical protein